MACSKAGWIDGRQTAERRVTKAGYQKETAMEAGASPPPSPNSSSLPRDIGPLDLDVSHLDGSTQRCLGKVEVGHRLLVQDERKCGRHHSDGVAGRRIDLDETQN